VFLFDEPLSNLDAALRAEMRVELARLHRQVGSTMIYVTHDQIEAMTMADRIVVLNQGEIVQVGAPMELYSDPANRFVAEFIGAPKINMISASPAADGGHPAIRFGSGATLPLAGFDLPPDEVMIGVRPEHVRVGEPGSSAIGGQVELVEHLGADALVHLRSAELGEVLARVPGNTDLSAGRNVALAFSDQDLFVFDREGRRIRRRH
jgi:ABC-type sugar transport system ATPase subunit